MWPLRLATDTGGVAFEGETGESRDPSYVVSIEGLLEGAQDGREEAGVGKGDAIAGRRTCGGEVVGTRERGRFQGPEVGLEVARAGKQQLVVEGDADIGCGEKHSTARVAKYADRK